MNLDDDLPILEWKELNELNERLMIRLFQTNCRIVGHSVEVVGRLQDSSQDLGGALEELKSRISLQIELGDLLADILGYEPNEIQS